jgi:Flp pilus assembly protein TadG
MKRLITSLTSTRRALRRRIARFTRSKRGVAAVEFALITPLMVLLWLGMTEVTTGVTTDRKVTLLGRSLADLTGRVTTVTNTERDNIFGAAASVLAPYDSTPAKMVISSVVVKDAGGGAVEGRVCWSEAKGPAAAARAPNSVYPVPEGFKTAGTSFVLAEVELPYLPMFGYAISGTINLKEIVPWPVRNVREVARTGVTPCL